MIYTRLLLFLVKFQIMEHSYIKHHCKEDADIADPKIQAKLNELAAENRGKKSQRTAWPFNFKKAEFFLDNCLHFHESFPLILYEF